VKTLLQMDSPQPVAVVAVVAVAAAAAAVVVPASPWQIDWRG
jgi:hypothetical protein